MRNVILRWFSYNRNHVWTFSVGFLSFFLILNLLIIGGNAGEELVPNSSVKNSKLIEKNSQINPNSLRRVSEDDDEIHDEEISKAVLYSLHQWNSKKIRKRVKRDEEVVCYGELGCFRDEGPFDYLDMLPSPPEEISTKFYLYTRENRDNPQVFSYFNFTTSLFGSHFNSSAPTKIIIHGFGSTCSRIWATEMRLTILSVVECNVICVDWENGATMPNYVRAAVNTRLVGKQVALLISWLNEKRGSRTEDFHLIGFSLGAHVAGFTGQELRNISRITGLDPAGPLYESYDKKVRLDSSDALFVDVIHSNGDSLLMGGLGSWEPMGHVDFYPNGGRVQKGCSNLFLGAVRDFLWSGSENDGRSLCNHRRAYKFFTESISPRCPFPSFSCESYDKFLTGSCFHWDTTKCGNMGYFADRLPPPSSGLLYLITREDEPFCANQYRISVESSPSSGPISTYGGLEAVLIGHDAVNETFLLTASAKESLVPGTIVSKMIVAHPALTSPLSVQLKYTAYSGWLYSGISRWSMDSLVLTNAYGKSMSFCARLLLPSGVPVTIRLSPGPCRFPSGTRPIFPLYPYETLTTTTTESSGSSSSTNSTSPEVKFPPQIHHIPIPVNESGGGSIGPPYTFISGSDWHPVPGYTPVETFPHIEIGNEEEEEEDTTTNPLPVELKICQLVNSSNSESGLKCSAPEEPVMSDNALGQIVSYHEEVVREEEELSSGANNINGAVVPTSTEGARIPLHLSYILQQLENQGLGHQNLGDGTKLATVDSSHMVSGPESEPNEHMSANFLRSLDPPPVVIKTSGGRRLVGSSRALKGRPVSLSPPPPNPPPNPTNRRTAKILDLGRPWLSSPSHPKVQQGHFYPPNIRSSTSKTYFMLPSHGPLPVGGRLKYRRLIGPYPETQKKSYFEEFRGRFLPHIHP